MDEKIFIFFVFLIFIYFIYQEYGFQKSIFFGNKEGFTPQDVENIIQPPGSNKIGTIDKKYWKETQNKVVSIALTYIHGIGLYSSKKICKKWKITGLSI